MAREDGIGWNNDAQMAHELWQASPDGMDEQTRVDAEMWERIEALPDATFVLNGIFTDRGPAFDPRDPHWN